jgi:predicted amidophosphoribosyltransferase
VSTTRSKRMVRALMSLGWDIDNTYESRVCKYCRKTTYADEAVCCSNCGQLLPKLTLRKPSVHTELERCMKYALGESVKLPGNQE